MKASRLVFAFALALVACTSVGCGDDDDDGTTQTPADTGLVGDTAGTDTGGGDTGTTDTGTGDTGTTDTGTPGDTAVGDTAGDTAGTKHTVNVGSGGNTFSPATLTIRAGDTVEWVWAGPNHTVTETSGNTCTARSGGFDSGLQNTGFRFTRTFSTTGTINYMCTPHCAEGMKGSITVNP